MRFGVLGQLAVWTDAGERVPIPERKIRALLIDLLLQDGRPVSADRLADDIWEGAPPAGATNTLQTKISLLRRTLARGEPDAGNLLTHGPTGYVLRVPLDAVDAWRFRDEARRGRERRDPGRRAAALAAALDLWRGPALADVADAHFARIPLARLEDERLTALEDLAEARLELGHHADLADELAEPAARHPLRERLRTAHMLALYRAGRQGDALAAYAHLRAHLAGELGVAPSPASSSLVQRMRSQDPALAAPAHPDVPRANLPAPLTPLVGRADDVARVRRLQSGARLVTLSGPGGVGKTRLAIEVATRLAPAQPDGAWLVELGGLDPNRTDAVSGPAQAVATALGLRDDVLPGPASGADPVGRLAGALRGSRALLVLDNCEHVLAPVAALARALLEQAPGLRVLATSREPLGLTGEVVYAVPPLAPAAAIELFVARACESAPELTFTEEEGAVAELCRRLDGIPLALELAASRVRGLGLHELAPRLGDRFRLLAAGGGAAPHRQRTLRATIDWSWDLLGEPERAVLRRLSVHAESFCLESAAAVSAAGDVTEEDAASVLGRLVDRSLVVKAGSRYRLLESVAEYCTERLADAGETDATRVRHQGWYLALAERADSELRGPSQKLWLRTMDAESPNVLRALDAAVGAGRREHALRLAGAMAWHRFLRGRLTEALRALDAALALGGGGAPRARVAVWRDGIAALVGEGPAGTRRRPAGAPADGDGVRAMWFRAFVECDMGDLRRSEDLVREALSESRRLGDRWTEAASLTTAAKQSMIRGDVAAAARDGEAGLASFRDIGDRWGQLQAIEWLGASARARGDYASAEALHRDGLASAEELGLWPQAADQLAWLGRIAMHRGRLGAARELLERALRIAGEQRYRPGETFAELGLGMVARRQGRLGAAETHVRQALRRSGEVGAGPRVAAAVGLAELGFVAEQRGDAIAAEALHREGLHAARRLGDPRVVAVALVGLAGARALAGEHIEAAHLLGAAAARRSAAGASLPAADRADVDRVEARVRAALGVDVLQRELAVGGGESAAGGEWSACETAR